MNINQIKYFVSTVENGSFSAAAAEQFITAQGISKAIADLEKELGEPLLIRKNRGVVPTAFGLEFLKRADLVNRCFTNLETFSKSYEAVPENILCAKILICAPDFPNMDKVKASIEAFLSMNLGIAAFVSFAMIDACLSALRDGSADAVIAMGEAENIPDIYVNVVGSIPCGLQMAKSNPLAGKPHVKLADLAKVPAVFWPGHELFNESVMRQLAEKGVNIIAPAVGWKEGGYANLLAQNAVVFIPRIQAIDDDVMDTVAISFDPAEELSAPLCLLTLENSTNPKVLALKSLLFLRNRPQADNEVSVKILDAMDLQPEDDN